MHMFAYLVLGWLGLVAVSLFATVALAMRRGKAVDRAKQAELEKFRKIQRMAHRDAKLAIQQAHLRSKLIH